MKTITDVTDYSDIEDAIADWVESCSDLPEVEGGSKTYWEGFDFSRKRPYATLDIVSEIISGKPWASYSTTGSSPSKTKEVTLYQPFTWSVDINFFTDSYDEDRIVIRETARRYAQRVKARAFIPENSQILRDKNIAYSIVSSNITSSNFQDDDKYIKQASVEFRFNGIAETKMTDTDYFTTVTDPTITYTGA